MKLSKVNLQTPHFDVFVCGPPAPQSFDALCEWALHHVLAAVPFRDKKSAIVFDVDDTLVDENYEEISSVCNLYRSIGKVNVDRFIVTARPNRVNAQTATEIQEIDTNLPRRIFHMPGPANMVDVTSSVAVYKAEKRRWIEQHYNRHVLMTIGDQWWDLIGSPKMLECIDRWTQRKKLSPKHCYVLFPASASARESTVADVAIKLPSRFAKATD
jgi:hypothetical protein